MAKFTTIVAAASALALTLAACGGGDSGGGTTNANPDDGTQLTMWVRSATDQFSQRLVDAYNSSHKNKVALTIIPNDNYLTKVGTAAGSRSLPDILASDVVYTPNYTKQGLFQDLTAEIKALPYYDNIAKSHLDVASYQDKIYAVPHKLDSSVFFWNKDLFRQAGLDPEKPPKNFDEIYEYAKKITALGNGITGFDLAGNCGGCGVYTLFPYAWADGREVLSADGKKVDINNDSFKKIFTLYKRLSDENLVDSSDKTQDGSTWPANFLAGKVGMLPLGSPIVGDLLKQTKFEWGVTALMSPDGSKTSTFIGGDVAGISATSTHKAQAWDFLNWTLEESQQVEIICKNGDLPGRTDLSGNKYTAADPRTKTIADGLKNGKTPFALPFGDLFNNPNGPWVATIRAALYGGEGIDKALADGQAKIQQGLDSAN
ncbi:MAG TPA: sugar ABC transporter substrate-binding protein [Actinophytocola sp.]|uniref:ABC transporter substrate-binding protein n=1 Tax=Actinophytocola sp. TaxID=1872138 RepID=UPI002DDCF69A|nr:sugar ABC transporter substrate-binding protein [Actinophytocola sp.]HEV2782529.1 sugar ABC transporter substrate-binding protein [Actinophytocola sp.]